MKAYQFLTVVIVIVSMTFDWTTLKKMVDNNLASADITTRFWSPLEKVTMSNESTPYSYPGDDCHGSTNILIPAAL